MSEFIDKVRTMSLQECQDQIINDYYNSMEPTRTANRGGGRIVIKKITLWHKEDGRMPAFYETEAFFEDESEIPMEQVKREDRIEEGFFLNMPALERLTELLRTGVVRFEGSFLEGTIKWTHTLPEALEIVMKEVKEKES